MIRIRTAAARTAAVAAIIGAAGLGAAGLASAATPYTASDLTYLDILDENDITYTSTDFAIDMGYEICYQIDNGASLDRSRPPSTITRRCPTTTTASSSAPRSSRTALPTPRPDHRSKSGERVAVR